MAFNFNEPVHLDNIVLERETITLNPGGTGLGIIINGGTDNPHTYNGTRIYVIVCLSGRAASIDGRLQTNDMITSVNGLPLFNVTRAQATAVLENAGSSVCLTVERRRPFVYYWLHMEALNLPDEPGAIPAAPGPIRRGSEKKKKNRSKPY